MAKKLTAGVGKKTKKGTLVTQAVQDAANADAAQLEVIEDNTQQVLAAIPTAIAKALETIGLALLDTPFFYLLTRDSREAKVAAPAAI